MKLFRNNYFEINLYPMIMVGVHYERKENEFDVFLIFVHIHFKFYMFNRKKKPSTF